MIFSSTIENGRSDQSEMKALQKVKFKVCNHFSNRVLERKQNRNKLKSVICTKLQIAILQNTLSRQRRTKRYIEKAWVIQSLEFCSVKKECDLAAQRG